MDENFSDTEQEIDLNNISFDTAVEDDKPDSNNNEYTTIIQLYLNDAGKYKLFTVEEERKFCALAKAGDMNARDMIIKHNLRLVINIAKRYRNRGIDFEDLISEGNIGMMHAIEKFDPTRECRFSTYATWWIRQYIERHIMNHNRLIRLPVHIVKDLNKVIRAKKKLEKSNNPYSIKDIANITGLDNDLVYKLLNADKIALSLDSHVPGHEDEPDMTLTNTIIDESTSIEDQIDQSQIRFFVRSNLDKLTDIQQTVLKFRYGIDHDETTLEDLGRIIGVTRERVRQIQKEAHVKLKKLMNASPIRKPLLLRRGLGLATAKNSYTLAIICSPLLQEYF